MATTRRTSDKPDDKTTDATEPAKPDTPQAAISAVEENADDNGRTEYTDKALSLAGDVRDYVDKTRADLNKLLDRLNDDVQQTERTFAESPVAEGVRRIPMAAGDVIRALQGLAVAASDLQARASA